MSDLDDLLAALSARQQRIASARPLPPETLRTLREDFLVRYAHETTAIEGNSLTLMETKVVLEGITVGGKTMREHLEVLGVRDAWEQLQQFVQDRAALTETMICDLHRLLTASLLKDQAGQYRTQPVYIQGSMHVPPNWVKVPDLMNQFADRFAQRPVATHPIRWAAQAHADLAGIHPFVDGNGRVSRMVVNLLLMRDGWPPALYTATNRAAYLKALKDAQYRGDSDPFVRITAEATRFMIDRYLHAIGQVQEGDAPMRRRAMASGGEEQHPPAPPPGDPQRGTDR